MSDLKVRPAKEKQDSLVRSVQRRQEFVLADRLRKWSLRVSRKRRTQEPRLSYKPKKVRLGRRPLQNPKWPPRQDSSLKRVEARR